MAELKKNLGFWAVFFITITAMIGTGMFFGTAIAAEKAGNLSILAWVLLGIITIYVGACFGELTSMYPTAGGIYEFTKQAYGKGLGSFLTGWATWIVINITNSLLIVAALDYLLPSDTNMLIKMALSIVIIILLNWLAYRGTESISTVLGIFAFIIVAVMITLVVVGSGHIDYANYSPMFSAPAFTIFLALFFIVETFFGWENATFMAEETKDAEKTIPRALMMSSIFVAILGILLAVMMLGVMPHSALASSSTPLADLTAILFNPTYAFAIKIGIALALIGSAAGGLLGTPRLLLGLARDKFFIEQLADIHPKYQTPYKAIIFQAIISILVVIIGFGRYTYLLALLVPLALMMYITVLLAVPILRHKHPHHPRPFKVWFGKIGPIIVSLIYATVIIIWLYQTPGAWSMFRLGLSFVLFGIPIFLLLMLYYDPDSIKRINDSFAPLGLWFESFNFPKKFRKELLSYFEDLENKTVLEYGSGIGTLTMHLAESVGSKGKVYAVDMSKKNIEILSRRLFKKNFRNVVVVHDEHQINRVHPGIKNIDVVFSVGSLSYIQDIRKVLKEMYRILPKNGKICMVEYVDYFWVLPNVKWLSDNAEIERVFRECGFAVHVKRKRRWFWSYVIIYGIKTDDQDTVYI